MKLKSVILLLLLVPTFIIAQITPAKISKAAQELTKQDVIYDPAYVKIPYPNGDVPANKGVCSDVIIRTFRKIGIDLQVKVHEDMEKHFSKYPNKWGLKKPDTNIDHRRVPNLMTYFSRQGFSHPISIHEEDYQDGDIVVWRLSEKQIHIGIVVEVSYFIYFKKKLIIHNIGNGQVMEDFLFSYPIIGHYRYPG